MALSPASTLPIDHHGPESRLIERINLIFSQNRDLSGGCDTIQVSVQQTAIVLRGKVPSSAVKQLLIPAIRQAGILWQVCNLVDVSR